VLLIDREANSVGPMALLYGLEKVYEPLVWNGGRFS
jgi:hypothetical protein